MFHEDGTTEILRAFDFSIGGIQVHSPRRLPEGPPLRIAIRLFSGEGGRRVEINAFARAVYNIYDSTASCFRIGLSTIEFEGNSQEIWEREFNRGLPDARRRDRPEEERRTERRFHYRHSVIVGVDSGTWLNAVTADLSRTGMRISIDRNIEAGRLLRVRMRLVHPKSGEINPVETLSSVVYSFHAAGGGFDMGVVHRSFEAGEEALLDEIRYRLEPFASTLK